MSGRESSLASAMRLALLVLGGRRDCGSRNGGLSQWTYSAQLAAAHPVSGGTYEYGYRWLHPSLGFTAGLMFLCAKSASAATAALGFAGYGLRLLGWDYPHLQVPSVWEPLCLLLCSFLLASAGAVYSTRLLYRSRCRHWPFLLFAGFATLLPSSKGPSEAISVAPPIDVTIGGILEACA